MFRYASKSINNCRCLCTKTARESTKYNLKLLLMQSSCNYLLLARSESTGTVSKISNVHASAEGNSVNVEKSTASIETQVDPSVFKTMDSRSTSTSDDVVNDTGLSSGAVSPTETLVNGDQVAAGIVNNINQQFNITLNVNLYITPDATAIPKQEIEEVLSVLAANGEPTLRSLGLASNWPCGLIQQALEFLHCDVGLPWWGAIVAGTVVLCLSTLSTVGVKRKQQAAAMQNNTHQIQGLQVKIAEAKGNALMDRKYRNDLAIFIMKNPSPYKPLWLLFCQAPIFLSCFFGLRSMANLLVESMKTGGMLWFQDLTLADPFYILPLVISATVLMNVKCGTGAEGAKLPVSWSCHVLKYVGPIVVFSLSMNIPAAIQCSWATLNVISLAWNHIKTPQKMDNEIFKKARRATTTKTGPCRYDPAKPAPSSATKTIYAKHIKSA